MWCRSYRDHVIMAFPSFDTSTNLWAPQANISWVVGPVRESAFVRFPKRVMTEGDAVAWALDAAPAWIDRRLSIRRHKPPRESEARSATPSLRLVRRGPPNMARSVTSSRSIARMLTFAQFKSLIGKSRLNDSEQALQKSYAALVELRKHKHCSWAEIKFKVRHSREDATPARALVPGARTVPLPLTMQDWQRII
jgi:hypothetical protein